MGVPFSDLRAMHDEVRAEIEAGWRDLVDRSAFVGGQAVVDFERAFAEYCSVPHSVGVGTGTDALRIALQAVGVRPGDVVITVPHTFIATVEGITQVGAHPVFVDIEPTTYTMDVELTARYLETQCKPANGQIVERRSGRRVSCLLPVDLYGHPAQLDALLELARKYDLRLVEDACQAHGARWKDQTCGSFGDAAAFSFYPGKNLGAMGEAGAIATSDAKIADRCRVLREHGQTQRYIHETGEGSNARLDALQAVVLSAKLRRLEAWNDARRRVALWYAKQLKGLDLVLPPESRNARHVYHLYVVQIEERDRVRRVLTERGIGTGLHYPVPLHLQQAYSALSYRRGEFPVSEQVAERGLSLPMFPHLTAEQVAEVAAAMRMALVPAAELHATKVPELPR